MQGPPDQRGYDYYGGPPPAQAPMHSRAPRPATGPPSQTNYNYGQHQGPDYKQQPAPYSQTAPQGYGQGYGEPRYDHQGPGQPGQHPYGGQGTQPSTYPQGTTTHPSYGQHDQYNKPGTYNTPQQAVPYGQQPYGQPQQQPSSGSMLQAYPQYGIAPMPTGLVLDRDEILNIALVKIDQLLRSRGKNLNDIQHMPVPDYRNKKDWSNPLIQEELSFKKKDMEEQHASLNSGPAPGGYGQQGGQPMSAYVQTSGQQQAPGYAQAGPTTGYGYQGAPDPAYGAPPVQPAYSQPAPAQAPVQPGYDQSIPQTGGHVE
ncbi:K Homology domain-containing protein [Artemisia annua]|uniref:K Homology domain-containing protein n=1 Tax=Artemisia annua TaxID=35608 RepID=A0A2U1P9S5_ARTAN|nr:K Homology domain-containing protein [Artemisia annua]